MTSKIFTTYDSKAEAYLQPFFMKTRGEAIRGWQTVCNDPKTQFNQYPADFTLFEIGEYDETTGQITPYQAKVSLGVALEFLKDAQTHLDEFIKKPTLAKTEKLVNNQ